MSAFEVKRTLIGQAAMSANDPKRTMSHLNLLWCTTALTLWYGRLEPPGRQVRTN